ncbi:kinase-like domain-containing protein [Rhizophagus clarus]|uniref:Kinase-like domain-containing protein n=1 Tax=Rhizophagus clarus TaxID=94130 RepID=A0A8H3L091_9GLOM|nr:kinase-like domain-containing protein [Rhizophagus clarus]
MTIKSCLKCRFKKNFFKCCNKCKLKHFKLNYGKSPSGNNEIDKIFRDNYCESNSSKELIEWIPYNEFKNIACIGIEKVPSKYYIARYRKVNITVILMKFESIEDLLNY